MPRGLRRELAARPITLSGDSANELVFAHRDGRPYTRRSLDLVFAKSVAAASLNPALTAGALRQTYAAWRIKDGCDLATLSAELGQAIDSTYRSYAGRFASTGTLEQARQARREAAPKRPATRPDTSA
jgi:site-specific recombinase XerD